MKIQVAGDNNLWHGRLRFYPLAARGAAPLRLHNCVVSAGTALGEERSLRGVSPMVADHKRQRHEWQSRHYIKVVTARA